MPPTTAGLVTMPGVSLRLQTVVPSVLRKAWRTPSPEQTNTIPPAMAAEALIEPPVTTRHLIVPVCASRASNRLSVDPMYTVPFATAGDEATESREPPWRGPSRVDHFRRSVDTFVRDSVVSLLFDPVLAELK